MTTLYANPYDINFTGFYFNSSEEFETKMSQASFEEVEIDYIDGDNPKLFNAVGIYQSNVDTWFNELDQFSDTDDEAISICYLIDFYPLDEAIERRNEAILYRGNIKDYAAELIDELYSLDHLPELIQYHIDFEGIAKDMELNSEVAEISHNVWVVNCRDF